MATVKLKNVRLSFPELWTPKAFKEGDKPMFKASFLIPKGSEQAKTIDDAILNVLKEKWGKQAEKILASIQHNVNKFCWQDGDNKSYDGYEGMRVLSAKNAARPLILDKDKSILSITDGKPYAGCYVNASVEIFAYDNTGKGVSASLGGVQFVRDGDSFAGAKPAKVEDFDDLSAEDDEGDDLV